MDNISYLRCLTHKSLAFLYLESRCNSCWSRARDRSCARRLLSVSKFLLPTRNNKRRTNASKEKSTKFKYLVPEIKKREQKSLGSSLGFGCNLDKYRVRVSIIFFNFLSSDCKDLICSRTFASRFCSSIRCSRSLDMSAWQAKYWAFHVLISRPLLACTSQLDSPFNQVTPMRACTGKLGCSISSYINTTRTLRPRDLYRHLEGFSGLGPRVSPLIYTKEII